MKRSYQQIVLDHFTDHEQMLFVAGPRQVGKRTLAKSLASHFDSYSYLNFDIESDRHLIIKGETAILENIRFYEARFGQTMALGNLGFIICVTKRKMK